MNGRRLLVASVISVQNSRFVYPSCQNCFSKLLLDLKRYSCLKCGCSGDSREANYRYRLSLEVADTQSVFEVTVFGSCLDVYFGVTAKGLQRYIEKLYQEVGEPDGDANPDVLIHAVETCFIGKKFVFGIKSYDKPESTSSQQNGCRTDRYPRTLTACQMFMPNSGLIGNTVIHYLQQCRCSHFKQGHGGIWPPDLFTAFDQPSSELSSLHGSSDLAVVPSCSTDGLSVLWPQSFGWTSSPDSSGIAADPIDLNPSKSASTRQKEEDNPVSLSSQLTHNSWDHSLTKRNVVEDKGNHLHSSLRNCIAIKSQPESDSTLGRKDSRLLQSPAELEEKNLSSKMSIQNNYWLQKSCNHLLHQRQDTSLCFPASPSIHLPAGEHANSQEIPWLWEELPSSESFSEFIAKIENDKAMVLPTKVQMHFPSDGADEFHGHFNQLSAKPGIFHGSLKTDQPGEELQVLAEKAEQHILNPLPSHNHQEAFYSSSSSKGKEKLGDLSHQHLHLLPSSSSVEVETHSEESCLKSEEGADQNVSISKNHHSESSRKCLENFCLQTRNIIACLNDNDDGNLFKWRGKGSPSNLNQTTDTTNIREDSFASRTCKKSSGAGGKMGELLFQVDGCSFKRDNSSLLQNCSDSHEVSYNASADLFDSAREAEATVEKLNSAHILLAEENPMTKQCVTPGFISEHSLAGSLCELNGSCNTSSLCSMLITSDPKTNSPIAGLISGSEHSLAGSLDFIPNSQSTPLARPCLQVRLPRELPLNKLSCVGGKCKRLWPALKSPSVRQLVSEFLQSRRLNDASDCQQLFTKGSPSQGLPEKDSEEWIPPSEKKQVQPLGIQSEKVLRKRRNLVRNNADCQAMGNSHLSESKVRRGISRSSVRLERVELSPKTPTEIIFGRQPMCKDDANYRQVMNGSPGSSIISDARSNLSSTSCPMSDIPSWSPELFSDNCQLLSTDAVFSKPST